MQRCFQTNQMCMLLLLPQEYITQSHLGFKIRQSCTASWVNIEITKVQLRFYMLLFSSRCACLANYISLQLKSQCRVGASRLEVNYVHKLTAVVTSKSTLVRLQNKIGCETKQARRVYLLQTFSSVMHQYICKMTYLGLARVKQ